MNKKICGVYKITNKINEKFYIGSSNDIYGRWYRHIYDLNNKNHHSKHLQRAWDKYSESNFIFEIIEECTEDIQFTREQYYLDTLTPCKEEIGYNIDRKAEGTLRLGENSSNAKFTNEQVKQMKLLYLEGYSSKQISKIFNVWDSTILLILKGVSYPEVEIELTKKVKRKIEYNKNKESIRKIAFDLRYIENKSIKDIADELDEDEKQVLKWIRKYKSKINKIIKRKINKSERQEQHDKILELYDNGELVSEISKLGYTDSTVRRLLERERDYIPKKRKSKEELENQREEIINLYKQGKSIIEIIKIGYSRTTVRRIAEKYADYEPKKGRTKAELDIQREEIIKLHMEGYSEKEIINMGYPKSTVQKNIKKYKDKIIK